MTVVQVLPQGTLADVVIDALLAIVWAFSK